MEDIFGKRLDQIWLKCGAEVCVYSIGGTAVALGAMPAGVFRNLRVRTYA